LLWEGAQAHSRNKDGKNIQDATTAFKKVACSDVTLVTEIRQWNWT